MATIVPIRGVRYNPAKAGDMNDLITPPYDVIDPAGQEAFYERNPYNIIRLELGKKTPADNGENNRYTRAAETFRQWKEEGVLKNDLKPSLYYYEQEFEAWGEAKIRSGFISGVGAYGYEKGDVLPHEQTLPKHKQDRLDLMKATLANFSPIFGLYADPEQNVDNALRKAVAKRVPDIDVTDSTGVKNRLWVVDDEETVNAVVDLMANKKVFIADGHHRYETAVNFGRYMKEQGKEGYDFLMVALVNLYNEGLVVFPTHRLVRNVPDNVIQNFFTRVYDDFSEELLPAGSGVKELVKKLEEKGEHAFGIYAPDRKFRILKLQDEAPLEAMDSGHSLAWRKLDVTVLHNLILDKYLGIGEKQCADESNLTYTRDEGHAVRAVDSGEYQLAFFMNPTKVEEVTSIATGGEKMPQKSTFFYPKVIAGLVINDYTR